MSDAEISVATSEDTSTAPPQSELKIIFKQLRKNRLALFGVVIISIFVLVAVFAPFVAPYDPLETTFVERLEEPSIAHLLGQDEQGRDILSRIIHGSRISLGIGLISVGIGLAVGIPLGTISGYYGGKIDLITQRFIDILVSFPGILLAIIIISILGVGLQNVMIAIGISTIPIYARLVRGSVLSIKETDYVAAAKALGLSDFRIMVKHVLPNCMAPIIVQSTFQIATAILWAAGLGFLGLGAQRPTPEWGAMLSQGRDYLRVAYHLTLFPGIAIFLMVLGFNLLGDGLRDALDPKSRKI